MPVNFLIIESPVGPLLLAGDQEHLQSIEFEQGRRPHDRREWREAETAVLRRAAAQLLEYFAGLRRDFQLPLAPRGTPFQRAAWQALAQIPYGQTRSYAEQAAAIGRPTATRAIGAANGRNPLPIVLPCHRVIGANGALTGFGGGLDAKRWLLAHEAEVLATPR
jgi:methylated-DNA-[protein]-cysteine S-methyltransferase